MRIILLFVLVPIFTYTLRAQDSIPKHWVGLNVGSLITTLKFTDSQANQLDYSRQLNFSQGIGYSFLKGGFVLDLNIDYFGLSTSYTDNNVSQVIRLGYMQPSVNFGYIFPVGKFPFKPRVGAGFGQAFMINGEQITNGSYVDVVKSETLKTTDFGINLNAGVIVFSNQRISMSAMYNYRHGLSNIEVSSNNQTTQSAIHALFVKIQMAL